METFSALLAICAGNSPVTGEIPTQRPVTRSFDVFFDLRANKWLGKQSWGWWFETPSCSLWCQCTDDSTSPTATYRRSPVEFSHIALWDFISGETKNDEIVGSTALSHKSIFASSTVKQHFSAQLRIHVSAITIGLDNGLLSIRCQGTIETNVYLSQNLYFTLPCQPCYLNSMYFEGICIRQQNSMNQ